MLISIQNKTVSYMPTVKSPKFVHVLSKNRGSAFGSKGRLAAGIAVWLYASNLASISFKMSGYLYDSGQ